MVAQLRRPEADLKPEMLLFNDNQTNRVGPGAFLELFFYVDRVVKIDIAQCLRGNDGATWSIALCYQVGGSRKPPTL